MFPPPPPPWPSTPLCPLSASTFYTFTQHIKVASWVKGEGGNKVSQAKMVRNAEKFLYNLWEKRFYLWSIKCMNVCIRGYNCSQTGGIELSKCVYLASMGVKIEHTVGVQNKEFFFFFSKCISDGHVYQYTGHNQSQNCENLCFSPSKLKWYTRKIKYNWILLQILSYWTFRETCRHNHRYPLKMTNEHG